MYNRTSPTTAPHHKQVIPNGEKNDIDSLIAVIPKYKEWISDSAWANWQEFLHNAAVYFEQVPPELSWNLMELVTVNSDSSGPMAQETADVLFDHDQECEVSYCIIQVKFLVQQL